MAKNYEDLYRALENDDTFDMTRAELVGAKVAFQWLDEHFDGVPGRTITESEIIAAVDETNHEDMNEYQKAYALLVHLGYTVTEPTDVEKITRLILENSTDMDPKFIAEMLVENEVRPARTDGNKELEQIKGITSSEENYRETLRNALTLAVAGATEGQVKTFAEKLMRGDDL